MGRRTLLVLASALVSGACATAGPPPTVVVVAKDVQLRWDSEVVTVRPHPLTGRAQEVRREDIYREYWVKGDDGEWYRVPRADWEAARIGQSLEIRPGERERVTQPTLGPCIGPDARWR